MTPDTSAYMIAGFIVILGGAFIYILTLIARWQKAIKSHRRLDELKNDQ